MEVTDSCQEHIFIFINPPPLISISRPQFGNHWFRLFKPPIRDCGVVNFVRINITHNCNLVSSLHATEADAVNMTPALQSDGNVASLVVAWLKA